MRQTVLVNIHARGRQVYTVGLPFTWNALIRAISDKEEVAVEKIRVVYSGEVVQYDAQAEDGQHYAFDQPEPSVHVMLRR